MGLLNYFRIRKSSDKQLLSLDDSSSKLKEAKHHEDTDDHSSKRELKLCAFHKALNDKMMNKSTKVETLPSPSSTTIKRRNSCFFLNEYRKNIGLVKIHDKLEVHSPFNSLKKAKDLYSIVDKEAKKLKNENQLPKVKYTTVKRSQSVSQKTSSQPHPIKNFDETSYK